MSGQTFADLQRFAIPNKLRFEQGPGGLPRAAVTSTHAAATIYPYGAHVTHYQPKDQRPILFLSPKTAFERGKPIRGGVPVCFPWFGPRSGDATSPMHGFARTVDWAVDSTKLNDDGSVTIILKLDPTEATLKTWPFRFAVRYTVTIGPSLELALDVQNLAAQPFRFEEALHTYLAVSDVRTISLSGLASSIYIDKADGMKHKQQGPEGFRPTAETDRLYLNHTGACTIDDPRGERRLVIEKTGSESTVVWNPWTEKSKTLSDLAEDDWQKYLCVETANASHNAVLLRPNQRHQMKAIISSRLYDDIF